MKNVVCSKRATLTRFCKKTFFCSIDLFDPLFKGSADGRASPPGKLGELKRWEGGASPFAASVDPPRHLVRGFLQTRGLSGGPPVARGLTRRGLILPGRSVGAVGPRRRRRRRRREEGGGTSMGFHWDEELKWVLNWRRNFNGFWMGGRGRRNFKLPPAEPNPSPIPPSRIPNPENVCSCADIEIETERPS